VRRRSHVSVGRAGRVPGADPVAPAAGPDLRAARDHPREVVRSNHLHVYVSQAHKGELVMGAGVDSYTAYGQRGSFHIIEHQMAAAVEVFPAFARAPAAHLGRCRRRHPRCLPGDGLSPVDQLYVNCGWGTGGFKAVHGGSAQLPVAGGRGARIRVGEESQERSAWPDQLRVDNSVLSSDAMCQVRTVTSTAAKSDVRDHTRAMTRSERDHIIQAILLAASEPGLNPRTQRKRRATADLIAFLAGTGARIDEARRVRWQEVNLELGRVYLRGTKSKTSDRWLNLPDWLVGQLSARAADCGTEGYVFAAPAQRDPERVWNQSAAAVRAALGACGLKWAVRHTFRRTVATLLDQATFPLPG
jgi:hypothetical protein